MSKKIRSSQKGRPPLVMLFLKEQCIFFQNELQCTTKGSSRDSCPGYGVSIPKGWMLLLLLVCSSSSYFIVSNLNLG
jgi:hypothetical protein